MPEANVFMDKKRPMNDRFLKLETTSLGNDAERW
jgi:hypothetical protein